MCMHIYVYFSCLYNADSSQFHIQSRNCFKNPPTVVTWDMPHMLLTAEEKRQEFAKYYNAVTILFSQNVIFKEQTTT